MIVPTITKATDELELLPVVVEEVVKFAVDVLVLLELEDVLEEVDDEEELEELEDDEEPEFKEVDSLGVVELLSSSSSVLAEADEGGAGVGATVTLVTPCCLSVVH
jgi:hypothetical protein